MNDNPIIVSAELFTNVVKIDDDLMVDPITDFYEAMVDIAFKPRGGNIYELDTEYGEMVFLLDGYSVVGDRIAGQI